MRRLGHYFSFSSCSPSAVFASMTPITLAYLALMTVLTALLGTGPAVAAQGTDAIPADAIRIRIIAHSNSSFDQQVKRDVRDKVAADIESWGVMPASHDEARSLIASHLREVEQAANTVLRERGVSYGAEVKLGKVSFPDKMFGARVYAAGDYEALRISLGSGEGANWWCVLFPPLCLTAATRTEESAKTTVSSAAGTTAKTAKSTPAPKTHLKKSAKSAHVEAPDNADAGKPKARFFLWELLQKLVAFLRALFS